MNKTRTIFEGTVNGEKFDNINAYNARVNQLMESGEFVSATSSTRVEDITQEVEGIKELIKEIEKIDEKPMTAVKRFLPASDDSSSYIDDIMLSSDVQGEIAKLTDDLYELSQEVINNIPHNTRHQLETYLNAALDVNEKLIKDLKLTDAAIARKDDKIADIENKIEKLKEQIEDLELECKNYVDEVMILDDAYQVIDTYLDFYDRVIGEVNEAIEENMNECHCDGTGKCKCGCNCECNCGNHEDHCQCECVETDIKEVKPQRVSNITKLIDEIFGF